MKAARPPPQSNFRLIYIFTHKSNPDERHVYETLQPITQAKRNKSPFNTKETVIDYVLQSSVLLLNNLIAEHASYLEAAYPDSSEDFYKLEIYRRISEKVDRIPYCRTLTNYAKVIGQKQALDLEDYDIEIVVGEEPISRFKDRRKADSKSELNIIFTFRDLSILNSMSMEETIL